MMSPLAYEKLYLEDKTAAEILFQIESMRQQLSQIKSKLEDPRLEKTVVLQPSLETQLKMSRQYYHLAIKAYQKAGNHYQPNQTELKALQFSASLPELKQFILVVGNVFSGYYSHHVTLEAEHLVYEVKLSFEEKSQTFILRNSKGKKLSAMDFRSFLQSLYIGEWQSKYSLKQYHLLVLDGIQWSLELQYQKGYAPLRFSGDNAYPYNFKYLYDLFVKYEDFYQTVN